MIMSLIEGFVNFFGNFPSTNGVYKTISTSKIVEGKPKIDFGEKKMYFLSYSLFYAGTTTNTRSREFSTVDLKRTNINLRIIL